MKRFQFRFIHALAISAFLFSTGCTSDGSDEEVEDENRIHERSEDGSEEAALPSAEQAAAEANTAGSEGGDGTVDQSWTGEVQQLPSEQQMTAEDATVGAETPSTYAVTQPAVPEAPAAEAAAASTAGAETEAAPAAVAESTPPAESPALPAEAETAPADGIPTLADAMSDDSAAAPSAEVSKSKKNKGKKSARKGKRGKRSTASIAPTGDGKVYVVRPGDTLGSIASMLYGTRGRWKDLAEKNNLQARSRIYPGDSIMYTPDASTAAFEAKWDGLNKASVNVARGETLSSIAAKVMGNASYWKMIWQWNQETIADPNKIAVGQELKYVSTADMKAALSTGKNETDAH